MKRLDLEVTMSALYLLAGEGKTKLTLKLPGGGSIRDAIRDAGFNLGDRVVLVLADDAPAEAVSP